MNSDEMWLLQLWSGVFGAAISAVAAAGVAVGVLYFSNKHQTKLSEAALDLQRTLASVALEEQKKQFKIELEEQRERDKRDRERIAVHDAVTAADDLAIEYDKGLAASDAILQRMRSAVLRWSAETDDREAANELMRWPHHVSQLGIAAAKSLRPGASRNTPEYKQLVLATELFIGIFPVISQSGDARRKSGIDTLALARKNPAVLAILFPLAPN